MRSSSQDIFAIVMSQVSRLPPDPCITDVILPSTSKKLSSYTFLKIETATKYDP